MGRVGVTLRSDVTMRHRVRYQDSGRELLGDGGYNQRHVVNGTANGLTCSVNDHQYGRRRVDPLNG